MSKCCTECGKELNEDAVFCSECGKPVDASDNSQNLANIETPVDFSSYTCPEPDDQPCNNEFSQHENTECMLECKDKKRKYKLFVITSFIIIAIAIVTIFISQLLNPLSSGKIEKILNIYGQSVGMQFSDISVICSEPLGDVPGTEEGSEWHYVLCHGNVGNTTMYISYPIDIKNKQVADVQIKNPFLHTLWGDILVNGDKELNISMFREMKYYIKSGFDCFEDKPLIISHFLNELTGDNGLIPTTEARQIMISTLPKIYGQDTVNKWYASGEFHLLFVKGTANPKAIAICSTTKQYKWPYPESLLSTLDSFQKSELSRVYGEPYRDKTVWKTGLIDNQTFNTKSGKSFSSLESLKKYYNVE